MTISFKSQSINRVAVAGMLVLLGGCSNFLKEPDYRTQGASVKVRSLEIPPDLTTPSTDDRFIVPNPSATTFSAYTRDKGTVVPSSAGSGVLPKFDNVKMERAGDLRWLVVTAAPDRVWPQVKEFWQETGFILKRETPEAGIMETDWAENRSKIGQDPVRNTIGRFLDGIYSTGERDKFRTRIEQGANGTTEIYVSHRGVEEVFTNQDKNSTGWQFRPSDKDLEAEMLGRMMVKFGFATSKVAAVSGAVAVAGAPARATYDKNNLLRVNEPFDRAWRTVGLALDRSGFTVEDRDRSKGLFFVRYIDPELDAQSGDKKGWFEWMKFWKSDKPADRPQFRIRVVDAQGAATVEVQDKDGKPEVSATSKRILAVVFDQLK
jgi:outer membrane protein assembly factor BamC